MRHVYAEAWNAEVVDEIIEDEDSGTDPGTRSEISSDTYYEAHLKNATDSLSPTLTSVDDLKTVTEEEDTEEGSIEVVTEQPERLTEDEVNLTVVSHQTHEKMSISPSPSSTALIKSDSNSSNLLSSSGNSASLKKAKAPKPPVSSFLPANNLREFSLQSIGSVGSQDTTTTEQDSDARDGFIEPPPDFEDDDQRVQQKDDQVNQQLSQPEIPAFSAVSVARQPSTKKQAPKPPIPPAGTNSAPATSSASVNPKEKLKQAKNVEKPEIKKAKNKTLKRTRKFKVDGEIKEVTTTKTIKKDQKTVDQQKNEKRQLLAEFKRLHLEEQREMNILTTKLSNQLDKMLGSFEQERISISGRYDDDYAAMSKQQKMKIEKLEFQQDQERKKAMHKIKLDQEKRKQDWKNEQGFENLATSN